MNELFYTELRKTTIFVEEAITHQIFLKFQRKYFFAMIFYSLKLSHSFLVYNLCWTSIYQIFLKFQRKYFFFMIFPFIGIESFILAVLFQISVSNGTKFLVPWDKRTDVPHLSRDKGTTGQAQNLATGKMGPHKSKLLHRPIFSSIFLRIGIIL